jgi:tetratricopeptide (TPR) repeat protein
MVHRLSSLVNRRVLGQVLVVAGLALLVLWPLRSFVATVVANNVGSVLLNRALLAPELGSGERTAQAVEAGYAFQDALAWDPLNGQAYYNLTTIYDFWGDDSSAERAVARAAALSPGDACARFRLGQALAERGLEEQALREWRAADAAMYFVTHGQALARSGDVEGALEQYRRAISINPQLIEGYLRLGQALRRQGQQEEALAALESAAALESPMSPHRYLLQAEIYAAREEWSAALRAYQQAAALTPWEPEPHYRLGLVLAQELDRREEAIEWFQRALHLEPDHTPSRQALAQLYIDEGRCDEAARWLAPLLERETESVAGQQHVLLAHCLLEQGRIDRGLSHLEEAVLLNPRSVRHHLLLAQGYSRAERYRDAIEAYRQVLKLAPDNAQAQKALEELNWREP